jgi:hypothetical protein
MRNFMTLTEDGPPSPPRLDRHQFEEAYGRKPRMTGALDYFEAMAAQERGQEVAEFSCVGDDIESYIVTRTP